jgi:nucleoside phosphorylase
MIGIVVATKNESNILIDHLKLKKENSKFEIFKSSKYILIISGIGKYNAIVSTTHILSLYDIDMLFNIGIAGSACEDKIGSIFLVNKIQDVGRGVDFYPDILLKNSFNQCDISTYDNAIKCSNDVNSRLVDMESSGVFMSASKFLEPHKIMIVKIVSDNLNPVIPNKEFVYNLLKLNIVAIIDFINNYSFDEQPIYQESILNGISEKLKLTVSQKSNLDDSIKYYILNNGDLDYFKQLNIAKVTNKVSSKLELEKIIDELIKT